VLWVNLHGSFPLLFALQLLALFFGSGDRRKLLLALCISGAALLVNPHGLRVTTYVADMLSSPSNRYSNEWLPAVNRGWQANLFFLWFLLVAPLAAFAARRLTKLEWAWFLLFGWLGLYGTRYAIWFLFILCLATARLISGGSKSTLPSDPANRFLEKPVQNERPIPNIVAACLLLLFPLGLLPGPRQTWWAQGPPVYHGAHPIDAANWLAAHPQLEGPLWSDFSHSSYLIFALPSRPVWIDPRFELYPPEQWQRYRAIAGAAPDWQALLEAEGINLLLLSTGGEPLLIRAMHTSDQWCEQYGDSNAVIFSRRVPGLLCP
jgi:hypothetical protein